MFSILGEISINNKREASKRFLLASSNASVMDWRGSQWQPVDVCVLVIYSCHAKFGFCDNNYFFSNEKGVISYYLVVRIDVW